MEQIRRWLEEYGLQLLDLHGSVGNEKNWASSQEYQRLAGVELVKNRIEMTSYLSADVTIMHVPAAPDSVPVRRSLDVIEPFARERNVRIAIENGNFEAIRKLLSEYSLDYVGLCYDSGHGNVDADGLEHLDSLKDRLISVHLHDNDGGSDQHKLLFSGTVNWNRLACIMVESAYTKCVSMEVTMARMGIEDERIFLARAFETGIKFDQMIAEERHMLNS
jgi:sugar phosphate isomerase/epimerase